LTAYLMVLYGLGAVEAMQLVQSQRFCLAIEDGSKNMLQTFEDILKAKRDVAREQNLDVHLSQLEMQEHHSISGGFRRVSKRRYESANELDEAMEEGEWDEGENETEGRLGQAPFQDG